MYLQKVGNKQKKLRNQLVRGTYPDPYQKVTDTQHCLPDQVAAGNYRGSSSTDSKV
jgi:hypothetical protein